MIKIDNEKLRPLVKVMQKEINQLKSFLNERKSIETTNYYVHTQNLYFGFMKQSD